MEKAYNKNVFSKWTNQWRHNIIKGIGSLALAALPSIGYAENLSDTELECLAKNAYFESRSDNYPGRVAVTHVVLNRVHDSRYPDNICDVVYQAVLDSRGNPKRWQCQFSWYCDGQSDRPKNWKLYEKILQQTYIAYRMYQDGYDITQGSTHYHAVTVTPYWIKDKKNRRISQIGYHIFYKWEK